MSNKQRFFVLDGWRGISILLVLAGHLFPLGPKAWHLNEAISATGMVIFFILSGFLITNLLQKDTNIKNFLIRRFLRIVPLAWLTLIITFIFSSASAHQWLSSLLFYANWPPMGLTTKTSHFWSLCVEVQFYLLAALLVLTLKRWAFYVLPVLCLAVTINRILSGVDIAINTYFRLDEILCGCVLAIIHRHGSQQLKNILGKAPTILLLILVIMSANPTFQHLNYARPYLALLLIASTLFNSNENWKHTLLKHNFLLFVAGISYALYIIHGGLRDTWLGSGDTLEKYLKRPLFLLVTFTLAYLSTHYYESYWINLGKKLTSPKKPITP